MTTEPGRRIFHLVVDDDGRFARGVGAEPPVAVEQFERHGFVHCCFREQMTEIASWWFDPHVELVALELDVERLTPELRFERAPSRWYPHLYGPIDGRAVVAVHPVPRDPDGSATLPVALRSPPPAFRVTGRLPGTSAEALVRWQDGALDGDERWIALATDAIVNRRPVPLVGGVTGLATLGTAYEAYALLDHVADDLVAYEGDGFWA